MFTEINVKLSVRWAIFLILTFFVSQLLRATMLQQNVPAPPEPVYFDIAPTQTPNWSGPLEQPSYVTSEIHSAFAQPAISQPAGLRMQ